MRCDACCLPLTSEERILEACPACGAAFKVQSESEVEPTPPEEVWHADESEFARALRQACWVVALFAVFGLAFWWFGIRKMEAHNQGAVAANKAVPTNPAVKPVAEKVEPPVIVSMEEPEIELVEKDVVPDPPEPKPKPEPNVEPAPPPEPEPEPELELAEAPKPVAIIAKQAKPAKPPRQVKKKAVKEPKKPVPPKAPVEVAAIDRQIQNLERRRAALDRSQSHAKRDHERKLRDLARKRDQNDDKLKRKLESMQRSLKNMDETARNQKIADYRSKEVERNKDFYAKGLNQLEDLFHRNQNRFSDQKRSLERQMENLRNKRS